MSTAVMALCWPLQMPPTQKAVLISLADNANDQGYCWPSLSTVCERTCFGRTAVIEAIKWLEEKAIISADRTSGRHTTYQINIHTLNQSGTRTGPADGPVRQTDDTRPADGLDPSGRRTGPVRQTDTNRKEPSSNRKSNRQLDVCLPDWLPEATWGDWVQHRNSIKRPLSQRAAELTINKLVKLRLAGNDPVSLIENAIESGWQGIYAPRAGPAIAKDRPSIAQQFSQKTYTGTPDDDLPSFLRDDAARP